MAHVNRVYDPSVAPLMAPNLKFPYSCFTAVGDRYVTSFSWSGLFVETWIKWYRVGARNYDNSFCYSLPGTRHHRTEWTYSDFFPVSLIRLVARTLSAPFSMFRLRWVTKRVRISYFHIQGEWVSCHQGRTKLSVFLETARWPRHWIDISCAGSHQCHWSAVLRWRDGSRCKSILNFHY